MDFFPFTHGENIEIQRKEIGQKQKVELNEKYQKQLEEELQTKEK